MDWSVYVQAAGPATDPPLDEIKVDRFATLLSACSAAVTGAVDPEQDRTWSVQLSIVNGSDQPVCAIEAAIDTVTDAAREAGLPPWPVVKLDATEWQRFEAELDRPNTPDLVGVAELAELCGVTRQRASALARSSGFPEPLAELASGPVWDLRMVERFVREWPRKSGRPAKSTSTGTVITATQVFERAARQPEPGAKSAKVAKAAAYAARSPGTGRAKSRSAKRIPRD
jgi:hypothetical protein